MDEDRRQIPHPSPRPLEYLSNQLQRPLIWDSFSIDEHDHVVVVVVQAALIPSILLAAIFFALAAALVAVVFLPDISNFNGIQVELPSGWVSRIGALVMGMLIIRNAILRVRRAKVPSRIECSKERLRWSWPKLFTVGYRELPREQVDQAYGGYISNDGGGDWYVGIVDASGREHRLLRDRSIGGKEAELIGRHLRATLGLPETDQDGPDFTKWRPTSPKKLY